MHLRSVRLRGFKSFPDAVEVKLEPGVAVVVGPNGSGKSNVADAIVWAAGSLTPSEMRAERPDDVLFGGAEGKPAADNCEVELIFDNEDGGFGDELDYSEIAITRRLVRGGEGQYLVNKAPVRRTDLVELLADVGLGGSMHSIVSQGKVDAVLASKPEDRRHLVEEAAGLGKFKRRKHRAELKLARVQIQVERARDVEEEVRKRLRPLALQATAAERAEKLGVELGRPAGAPRQTRPCRDRRAPRDRGGAASGVRRLRASTTQESLAKLLAEREQAETELSDASGKREAILGSLYRLRSASERLGLRRESASGSARAPRRGSRGGRAGADRAKRRDAAGARGVGRSCRGGGARGREREWSRHRAGAACAHADRRSRPPPRARSPRRGSDELRAERRRVEAGLAEATGGQAGANRLPRRARRRTRAARRPTRERSRRCVDRLAREHERGEEARHSLRPVAARARAGGQRGTCPRACGGDRARRRRRAGARDARATRRPRALAREPRGHPTRCADARRRRRADRARRARGRARVRARDRGGARLACVGGARQGSRRVASSCSSGRVGRSSGRSRLSSTGRDVQPGRRRSQGLRPLRELATGPDEALRLLDGIWLVDDARLIEPTHGVVVTQAGHGYDADRGELWFAGTTAEAILLELDARRRTLADEVVELDARAGAAAAAADEAAAAGGDGRGGVRRGRASPRARPRCRSPPWLELGARSLDEQLARVAGSSSTLEAPIAADS